MGCLIIHGMKIHCIAQNLKQLESWPKRTAQIDHFHRAMLGRAQRLALGGWRRASSVSIIV
jgi:hypothetical protein